MTERPTHPKSTCCIPGCQRWSRKFAPGDEWICARHWRTFPRRCRRALTRVWARLEAMWTANAGDPGQWACDARIAFDRTLKLSNRLWDHGKRAAILREAGL